jgi:hypothetical protein
MRRPVCTGTVQPVSLPVRFFWGGSMPKTSLHTSFKLFGYLVAFAVFGAIVYSMAISITHWSGIGV